MEKKQNETSMVFEYTLLAIALLICLFGVGVEILALIGSFKFVSFTKGISCIWFFSHPKTPVLAQLSQKSPIL